jgi:hypothetical protein
MVKLMDKLERRLKEDAALIKAELAPELQERIRASLESTQPAKQMPRTTKTPGTSLWWASSLTGLAAAALLIVVINWNGGVEPVVEVSDAVPPGITWSVQNGFPLNAETAEWTAPLEEELKNLQSDLEKARESVERDLRLGL